MEVEGQKEAYSEVNTEKIMRIADHLLNNRNGLIAYLTDIEAHRLEIRRRNRKAHKALNDARVMRNQAAKELRMAPSDIYAAVEEVLRVYSYVYKDHSSECGCGLCLLNRAL